MELEEIRIMKRNYFIKVINKAIHKKALEYLQNMRGNKGREIEYNEIKMADYLMPNCEGLSISDKRYIFSMRNRMIQIPTNFPTKNKSLDENVKYVKKKKQ